MCYECFKEFKRWLKSFTRTEALLTSLEALLLIATIGFLIFFLIHIIVCKTRVDELPATLSPSILNKTDVKSSSTVEPSPECTWKPSDKTQAVTHYYENGQTEKPTPENEYVRLDVITPHPNPKPGDIDELALDDVSDGEDSDELHSSFILALVRVKPNREIIFGCILTVITEYWTLTAASCLDSIEEVDSLDSFVIMEGYGGSGRGRTHAVEDVQVHHFYRGTNRSYDLAALKSEDRLGGTAVELASMVDYFLATIGGRFSILGFGGFRTINKKHSEKGLRKVYVYILPSKHCPKSEDVWSPRLLLRGEPVVHAACGTVPMCAGVLYSRGTPCNYCSGTPLLQGATLFGIMSDNHLCGSSCEPALYVNLAATRDWLDFFLENQ